ncbi:MAG: translocation/assembly module TamB domain-containing protein, partial [Elusimicrobia bacterium]|nr:translocation/assembly module TamB domain-containing protein [Elusimicrobiota bacterium]
LYGHRGSWRFSVLEDSWIRPAKENRMGTYRLATEFANIALGPASFVGSGVLQGGWRQEPKSKQFIFRSGVKINDWLANGTDLKPIHLDMELEGKKIKFFPEPKESNSVEPVLSGEIDFSRLPCALFQNFTITQGNKKIFFLNGDLCLEKPSFQLEGTELDAGLISGLLQLPFSFSGSSRLTAQGSTENQTPVISGELKLENGSLDKIPLDSLESKFKWIPGNLSLLNFQAKSKDYFTVLAKGNFPWNTKNSSLPSSQMDLQIKVPRGNLSFLNFLETPWIKNAQGEFSTECNLKGSAKNPVLDGFLEIRGGEFDSRYLAKKVRDFNLDAQAQSNTIAFKKFDCSIGKGNLQVSGNAHCVLEEGQIGFDQYQLKIKSLGANGIPIEAPELPLDQERLGIPAAPSRGSPQFELQISGVREEPTLSGWVTLENTFFSYPPPKRVKRDLPWLENADWNFQINTGEQTVFQNQYAYAKIQGQILLKGRKEKFTASGKLTSNEGTISLVGAKFDLKQAELEIVPPPTLSVENLNIAPEGSRNVVYLRMKAEQTSFTTSPQTGEKTADLISLDLERTPLTKDFDSKKIKFRSSLSPTLSSERVAMKAGMGVDLEGLKSEEKDLQLRQGIARLLDAQLASPLARALVQRTGLIDKIEISQDAPSSRSSELRGAIPTAFDAFLGQSILLEKRLGSKLGVGYKATLDKIKDRADLVHELQLRYPFYKGIWLYGSTELDSKDNLGRNPERKGGIQT